MPAIASSVGNPIRRRLSYTISADAIPNFTSWVSNGYRYLKFTGGSGTVSVTELPMTGVGYFEYQIVGGGAEGGGGLLGYAGWIFGFFSGSGGGGGEFLDDSFVVSQFGDIEFSVGVGGSRDKRLFAKTVGYGQYIAGEVNLGGTGASGTTLTHPGGTVTARPGGASAPGYLWSSIYSNFSYPYANGGTWSTGAGGAAGDGTAGGAAVTGYGYTSGSPGRSGGSHGGTGVTLWDDNKAGYGGGAGAFNYQLTATANGTTQLGFGNGGGGTGVWDGVLDVNDEFSWNNPSGYTTGAISSGDGTGGVVIIRLPAASQGAN